MDDHGELQPPQEPYTSPPHESTPLQDEPSQQRDLSRYSLTAEAASELFLHAGMPRSLRTVIRYCGNGTLDCIKVDTERNLKYLVARESVDARIVELKQITAFGHDALRRDVASHGETTDEPRHDAASHDATREASKKIEDLESRVGDLERENEQLKDKTRDLEILNTVKDRVIEKNEGMLATAHSQLMKFNRAVGQLAERLRLTAPEEDTSQIIAYLDAPTQATDLKRENFIDAAS